MIFLDHAATTPMDPRVRAFLVDALGEPLNPSSVHRHGQHARALLEAARAEIAELLRLPAQQIVFTSGASEANNLVVRGLAERWARTGRRLRVLASRLEHSCVRETVERLAARGVIVAAMMPVSESGTVHLPASADADLLCLMAAQNETGVIQPLDAARDFRARTGAQWLCDATQYVGTQELHANVLGASVYTLSSHKLYGPAGVGLLAGPGIAEIDPLITGGPQEHELRAGTQPVALIRTFAFALRLAVEERAKRRAHLEQLSALLVERLRASGVSFQLNGAESARLPGFLNLSFPGFTGTDLVIALDMRGISVSAGSACATGVMEMSPAIEAMFPQDPARAAGAIRLTVGKDTQPGDVIHVAEALGQLTRSNARR